MIEVTERARQELRRLLTDKVEHPQGCLRIIENPNGKLGLGVDIEMPGDQVIEYDGTKVLLISPELAAKVTSVTLDMEDTPEGSRLVIISG